MQAPTRPRPMPPAPHQPALVERIFGLARADFPFPRGAPSWLRWSLASMISLVGSLALDAALVAVGTAIFPATKGYVHFRFPDYARLTIVGVIIACVAWPIVMGISSASRWLFFRLAILVTLVLFLPDLYLLVNGQSAAAVGILMLMHLSIALVTYNALVHFAPPMHATPNRNRPAHLRGRSAGALR